MLLLLSHNLLRAFTRSSRTVQHRQPLFSIVMESVVPCQQQQQQQHQLFVGVTHSAAPAAQWLPVRESVVPGQQKQQQQQQTQLIN